LVRGRVVPWVNDAIARNPTRVISLWFLPLLQSAQGYERRRRFGRRRIAPVSCGCADSTRRGGGSGSAFGSAHRGGVDFGSYISGLPAQCLDCPRSALAGGRFSRHRAGGSAQEGRYPIRSACRAQTGGVLSRLCCPAAGRFASVGAGILVWRQKWKAGRG